MHQKRNTCLSLIGSCVLLALGTGLAFAVLVAGGSAALAGRQNPATDDSGSVLQAAQTPPSDSGFQGMVTDSRCGARHRKNSHLTSAECARQCVRQGASYVLVDGERRYKLRGGEGALDKFAGERAKISGTRQGSAIYVTSAESLFEAGH